MGTLTAALIGYIILISVTNVHVLIFGTCLIACGAYPSVALFFSWLSSNCAGYTKRGTVWALAEIMAQAFSIFGTQIYTTPPRFIKGHSILLAFTLLSLSMVVTVHFMMKRENAKRDKIVAEFEARGEVHPHLHCSLEEVYDDHILFRYVL